MNIKKRASFSDELHSLFLDQDVGKLYLDESKDCLYASTMRWNFTENGERNENII